MKKAKKTFGRTMRWTWAITFAVLAHVFLYWGVALTRSSDQPLRRQARQFTEIYYFDAKTAESSVAFAQQMTLFDPRPLLLPTRWNVSNVEDLLERWKEEAEIFPPFEPMFEMEDGNYVDDFGIAPANYDQLSLAQVEFVFPPFQALGSDREEVDFADRPGLWLELKDPASGETLGRSNIYSDAVAQLEGVWPSWRPMSLLATVQDGFQVGGLAVLESSGFDEADRELSRIAYLNFSRLGPLKDGVYLLEIVP